MQGRQAGDRGAVLRAVLATVAPERENALGRSAESLGRGGAEADDGTRPRKLDGAPDKGQAHQRFGFRRLAVPGRPPENKIGDEDAARWIGSTARQADRRQHLVEQLTGTSDEWLSRQVLLATRRLA